MTPYARLVLAAGAIAGLFSLAAGPAALAQNAAGTAPDTTYSVAPAAPGDAYGADPYAQPPPPPVGTTTGPESQFSSNELVNAGHRIFGDVSQGLASIVEHSVSKYGLPNGYVIGQEGSGALIGGARYGEGTLYTKNAGQHRVYWQGPSVGLDVGADGSRVMMLVYNLPSVETIYQRYLGVNGSAYVVAGLGMTVLSRKGIYVVPIVSGVGARLGINFGYLKFTSAPTWNPF